MPALVSQRSYARRRGVSVQAVNAQTATHGGPIPVHGKRKLIDPVEADALWIVRLRAPEPSSPDAREAATDGARFVEARVRKMAADARRAELELRLREGALISRERGTQLAFAFARRVRDKCQTWPARVGPQLAALFELDTTAVIVFLDEHMRELLTEIADERCDF